MELIKDVLLQLSGAYAPVGRESGSAYIVEQILARYVKNIKRDALGNIIAVLPARRAGAKKVMLDAHFDEISMLVSEIDDKGFVSFVSPFGVDIRILPAAEVIIHGVQEVYGVVSVKPPHLLKDEDTKKNIPLDELVIDTGFSGEKAKRLIKVGDSITFRARATELKNNCLSGKSFDNRAGVTSIIYCLELLKKESLNCELIILISVQEEAGTRGARVGGYSVNPDAAIVMDVSFASSPDTNKDKTGEMGNGVMIGIAPILKRELSEKLIDIAKDKKISYQLEVMAGNTGTNSAAIQTARSGIATGLLSIPLKYMHTPVETVMLSDIEATAKLLAEYLRGIKGDGKLW